MGIGSVIKDAVVEDAKKPSSTSLQDFLTNFSSTDGDWIRQIDPLSTFDVTMQFFPCKNDILNSTKFGFLGLALLAIFDPDLAISTAAGKLMDMAKESAINAGKNLLNNATGGLFNAFTRDVSIMNKHNAFEDYQTDSFVKYLSEASLLSPQIRNGDGPNIELSLGPYCQKITIPQLEIPAGQASTTLVGEFPINGTFVKTDSNVLTMTIVNTKAPLIDLIFYPWMREITLPFWSYATQPYTTATVTVDFTKHSNVKYVFVGCRPTKIMTLQAEQQTAFQNLERDVSFTFDAMFITSSLKAGEGFLDKLLSSGKTLFNGASTLMKANKITR